MQTWHGIYIGWHLIMVCGEILYRYRRPHSLRCDIIYNKPLLLSHPKSEQLRLNIHYAKSPVTSNHSHSSYNHCVPRKKKREEEKHLHLPFLDYYFQLRHVGFAAAAAGLTNGATICVEVRVYGLYLWYCSSDGRR